MIAKWMKQLLSMVVCATLLVAGAPAEGSSGTARFSTGSSGTGFVECRTDNADSRAVDY